MGFGIAFSPLVPEAVVWAALVVAAAMVALLFVSRTRGAATRAIALALLVLALANPSLTREDRDPLTSVAVVVVDKSPSQNFGDRTAQTQAARDALVKSLQRIPGLELRVIEAGQADCETDGTRLFPALGATLSDVDAREAWRRHSVIAELCIARVAGEGPDGYREALERLRAEMSR